MTLRRVVTGHSDEGKAIFVQDTEIDPVGLSSDSGLYFIWAGDEAPTFPDDGEQHPAPMYWPPVGGFRYLLMSIPPNDRPTDRGRVDTAEVDRLMPGLSDAMEPDEPGMHTSDTIDFEMVVSGEITLELDDGVMKTMHPGDAVIQNGTRHRWINRGTENARVAVILLGAHRQK